jgi:uncharacterized protein YerC
MASGICGLSFSVLEIGVPYVDLDTREAFWTDSLGSVNALPPKIVREDTALEVIQLIQGGMVYRDIAKRVGISLGSVAGIKRRFQYEQDAILERTRFRYHDD